MQRRGIAAAQRATLSQEVRAQRGMDALGGSIMRGIIAATVASLLLLTGVAAAQGVPKLHDVDPRLKAFNAEVVGYEGVAADGDAIALAFDPLDYLIEKEEELIAETQAHIAELRTRAGTEQEIAAYQRDIADAQRRRDALKARKQARLNDPQCEMGTKISEWQDLIRFLDNSIEMMQGAYDQVRALGPLPMPLHFGAAGNAMLNDPTEGIGRQLVSEKAMR